MGMYTQVKGFLCCDSIGKQNDDIKIKLMELKEEFHKREDLDRTWVCEDTVYHQGSNGSKWLFVGSEHKNYDESMTEWLKYLIENINCEGRIEFQYEEAHPEDDDYDTVWIVSGSEISIEKYKVYTKGYGFGL